MRPGDIVRHADYPQWGRGYVIRVKKVSCEIFFRVGGKRKIDANEPLEPSLASGVEAEFFALCASVSPRSWSRGRHNVYAVELDRAVWKNRAFRERNPGGAAGGNVYVGRDRADTRRAVRTSPGGHAIRTLRPHARPQAEARPGGRILAPAVQDCRVHGTESRRMVTGAGIRGVAELTRLCNLDGPG